MRQSLMVLLGWSVVACSNPVDPSSQLVPLEVSGTITVEGRPSEARVELWDNQWSDTAEDDVKLDWTSASANGEYHLATRVERGGCGQFGGEYHLIAEVDGSVHRETGEIETWGDRANVSCGTNQIVNINVELPDWLQRPDQSHAAS